MGAAKYPWEEWFSIEEPLHVDTDALDVTPRILQIQVANEAKRRGIKMRTSKCRAGHGVRSPFAELNQQVVYDTCLVIERVARPRRDWDSFLDGSTQIVWYSELKPVKPESFIRVARAAAKTRGLRIKVDRRTNAGAMSIRAFPGRGPVEEG